MIEKLKKLIFQLQFQKWLETMSRILNFVLAQVALQSFHSRQSPAEIIVFFPLFCSSGKMSLK